MSTISQFRSNAVSLTSIYTQLKNRVHCYLLVIIFILFRDDQKVVLYIIIFNIIYHSNFILLLATRNNRNIHYNILNENN